MSSGFALRWFLAAVLTSFLAGIGVGLVAPRLLGTDVDPADDPSSLYLREMEARYDLDAGQLAQIARILEARDRECREIAARGGAGRSVEQERTRSLLRADERIARVMDGAERRRFLSDSQVRIVRSDAQIMSPDASRSDPETPNQGLPNRGVQSREVTNR